MDDVNPNSHKWQADLGQLYDIKILSLRAAILYEAQNQPRAGKK
jgi:hypothetical protein